MRDEFTRGFIRPEHRKNPPKRGRPRFTAHACPSPRGHLDERTPARYGYVPMGNHAPSDRYAYVVGRGRGKVMARIIEALEAYEAAGGDRSRPWQHTSTYGLTIAELAAAVFEVDEPTEA